MRGLLLACFFAFVSTFFGKRCLAYERSTVVFLGTNDGLGRPVEYEQGGRFHHVALRFGDSFFHAHPVRGAEWTMDFSDLGTILAELEVPKSQSVLRSDVNKWEGLSYDPRFRWEDNDTTYCSKLIAQIFDIAPSPMSFSGRHWQNKRHLPRGALGLSPDDVYAALIAKGFSPVEKEFSPALSSKYKASLQAPSCANSLSPQ